MTKFTPHQSPHYFDRRCSRSRALQTRHLLSIAAEVRTVARMAAASRGGGHSHSSGGGHSSHGGGGFRGGFHGSSHSHSSGGSRSSHSSRGFRRAVLLAAAGLDPATAEIISDNSGAIRSGTGHFSGRNSGDKEPRRRSQNSFGSSRSARATSIVHRISRPRWNGEAAARSPAMANGARSEIAAIPPASATRGSAFSGARLAVAFLRQPRKSLIYVVARIIEFLAERRRNKGLE